jgi:acetyl esterase/lipase
MHGRKHAGFIKNSSPTTMMSAPSIPAIGTRAHRVNGAVADFFANHPNLELGGIKGFTVERQTHMEIFALHKLPATKVNPIGEVEFTAIRGPHGTIPVRVLYPSSGEERRRGGQAGALIYFHGGGYSVGSVDEFENGLRLVAEESACQVIAHIASTIHTTCGSLTVDHRTRGRSMRLITA